MGTPLRIKRSAVPGKVPAVQDLQLGELALNTYDAELYTLRYRPGIGTEVVKIGGASVQNVLYVNKNGDDNNTGLTLADAKATIKGAVGIASEGTTIKVASGTYVEDNPVKVPKQISIVGGSLREVTIIPQNADQDLFHVSPGVLISDVSFTGTMDVGKAIVAFDPDKIQYSTQSPYILNSTNFVTNSIGMKIDGKHQIGPFKSMVTDSFTQYNQNGIGVSITNEGYAQIVSMFTINSDTAVYTGSGGQCDLTNSNSSFGNFGLIADGKGAHQYTGTIASTSKENADRFEINFGDTNPHSIQDAEYDHVTGLTTITTYTNHGFNVGMGISLSNLGYGCTIGDYTHNFVYASSTSNSVNITGGNQVTPTSIAYNPLSGNMVMTVANHGLSGSTNHTVSNATYTPTTGLLSVTISNHGFNNGDYIKFNPNSLTFTCDKDSNATDHSYPRVTDPVYNKWLQISNRTLNTFEVNVGVSEDTSQHTFKSAVSGGLKKANNTVTIDPNSLVFTCSRDNYATEHAYPRSTDPAYNQVLGVESGDTNTFSVNVGVATHDKFPDNFGKVFSIDSIVNDKKFTVHTGPFKYAHDYLGGGKVFINTIRPFDGKVVYFDDLFYTIGNIKITNPGSGYNEAPKIFIDHPTEMTTNYSVTVDSKTADHPYFGQGSGKGYYVTGGDYGSISQAPRITFVRGSTYTFHQNDASNTSHAIYFSQLETAYGGTDRYETGVTYTLDGVSVDYATYDAGHATATTRSVSITVANDAPDTLYYACQAHGYMGASISVTDGSKGWGVRATAVSTLIGDHVDTLQMISNGRGYSTIPSISFSAPDVGINTATATIELIPSYYSIKNTTQISSGICTVTINENLPYSVGVGSTVPFFRQSRILASSHSFEYIGSGTDPIASLPSRGGVPIQENEVDNRNGGLVVYTSTDQGGNFRIGEGVKIDQINGTISGNFYSKSLFANVTPLILALGGDI